jgi:zinc D-Ala-D-Ala carboxypeptidase
MNLTAHFTLEELTASETAERNGWDNTPNDQELANLVRLAEFLEQVKEVLAGKPIIISSGLRTKKVNDAVGSKDTSQHRIGCAADFRVPGMTPDEVVKAIVASGIEYDQVIREFDRWTHISIPNSINFSPRAQALIIDKAGTRPYVIHDGSCQTSLLLGYEIHGPESSAIK